MIGELVVIGSFAIGVVVGIGVRRRWQAIVVAILLSAGSIAFVAWWQSANLSNLTSTSSLEYIFAPLYPVVGLGIGWLISRAKAKE